MHKISHNKLRVAQKSDRTPLVALVEQSKQILQLKAAIFDNEDPAKAMQLAIEFMTGIAMDYVDDQVAVSDIYAHRDKLLGEKNLAVRPRLHRKNAKHFEPSSQDLEPKSGPKQFK